MVVFSFGVSELVSRV